MDLYQFTTMRGYQLADNQLHKLIDSALNTDQDGQVRESLQLKRIQFDTTPELWHRLEEICRTLDCSKRHFLEMAISEAIDSAQVNFEAAFFDAGGRRLGDSNEQE
jgi:hypothetical protein